MSLPSEIAIKLLRVGTRSDGRKDNERIAQPPEASEVDTGRGARNDCAALTLICRNKLSDFL